MNREEIKCNNHVEISISMKSHAKDNEFTKVYGMLPSAEFLKFFHLQTKSNLSDFANSRYEVRNFIKAQAWLRAFK